ncbi:Copper resistance protein C precursor [Planococcus massiliensis]|uniref:Copper resistance protein C n=1 Tax=Planococcus massiliensis TaxID=1499687 RepID=A0A098EHP6_9BACL|nr:copper resistance CopC family protein [Planococcus massiliensis]CEG21834.1 Copper resistance protein C precursor [Planococcus massiliensis]
MKKIVIMSILFIFILPFTALGHTTLTASNPAEGEVLSVQPEKIELEFGTVIEEGSSMTLKGPEASVELSEISVSDNLMTGEVTGELPNGQYIIDWKIIGEDGHPIEGQILFGVDVEAPEEEVSEEAAEEEPAVEEETAEKEMAETAETAQSEDESSNNWVTVLIVAAIILVAAGMMKLMKNKR